jgi:hypothetical protein
LVSISLMSTLKCGCPRFRQGQPERWQR